MNTNNKELKKLRRRIDLLDRFLVYLINRRTAISIRIGKNKKKTGSPVFNAEREKEVLSRIVSYNAGPATDDAIRNIYERILEESRKVQA